jgi:hypothetical protein
LHRRGHYFLQQPGLPDPGIPGPKSDCHGEKKHATGEKEKFFDHHIF